MTAAAAVSPLDALRFDDEKARANLDASSTAAVQMVFWRSERRGFIAMGYVLEVSRDRR